MPTYRNGDEDQVRQAIKFRAALALSLLAGLLIAVSIEPVGLWPCAYFGVALWDLLLRNVNRRARFWRTFVIAAAWLGPTNLWMYDLTAIGYPAQTVMFAAMYALAALAVPAGKWRRLALPAALVLVASIRWNWPFGGVPLSTLAMSQVESPLANTARVGGSLMLVWLTGVVGVALSALAQKRWLQALVGAAAVATSIFVVSLSPTTSLERTLDVAIVQGGGPQRTRAANTVSRDVTDRHLAATQLVETPVDFVLWPENVIDTSGLFEGSELHSLIAAQAQRLDTHMVVGIVESFASDGYFLNASVTVDQTGRIISRYDKLRRVPFGEYVPMRSFVERFAPEYLPRSNARAGTGPGIIDTGSGSAAIAISWEIFHNDRVDSGIDSGGQIVINPTNGSSFWLTQVQSQQIASSQLRALETNRWVLQAAPTGYSAIIDPQGTVVERSEISEAKVLQATVEMRSGKTWASTVDDWPWYVLAPGVLMLCNRVKKPKGQRRGIGFDSLLSPRKKKPNV